jgi:hypothetical protein
MMQKRFLAMMGLMAAALGVQAHPGHAPLANGAAHFISSPYHLAALFVVAAGLWYVASFLKNRRVAKVALRTMGVGVALGSLALWTAGV